MKKLGAALSGVCLILVACGSDKKSDAGSQVVGDTGRTATPAATATASSAATTSVVTATAAPTATRTPTPTATPAPEQLRLVNKGFGSGVGYATGYGFIVENPNPSHAVEGARYQVAAYDAAGTVLKTDSGSITLMLPGERVIVGNTLFIDDKGPPIARLDVQVRAEKFTASDPIPGFTVENVTFRNDRFSPKVTGIVKSPYTKDVKQARVSVIAYDAGGAIIGGGFTFLDFVPANGQAAAEVSISAGAVPAKVEMYAAISGLSLLGN